MDESTWSFAFVVTVLTSFFSGADSFTHPAAVVTWTDAGHAVGDYRSVSAVCRVEMKVLPNGEQELPPDSVTVFFTAGHNQGNISFDTGSYTDRDCTQSRTVTSTYGYAMKSLDQGAVTVESADLYARLSKSKCVIDHGRTPNREIVIVVDPFTHLEATAWVCLASWHGRGTLSANLPRPKFAPVWNGDGMPQIAVSSFEDGRPRELTCTLDGYDREVSDSELKGKRNFGDQVVEGVGNLLLASKDIIRALFGDDTLYCIGCFFLGPMVMSVIVIARELIATDDRTHRDCSIVFQYDTRWLLLNALHGDGDCTYCQPVDR